MSEPNGVAYIEKDPQGDGQWKHVGTAIIVDDLRIMTCCHVVNLAIGGKSEYELGKPSAEDLSRMRVRFKADEGERHVAALEKWQLRVGSNGKVQPTSDIAVLRLDHAVPRDCGVAQFASASAIGKSWRCLGRDEGGIPRDAQGELGQEVESGLVQLYGPEGRGPELQGGYSGAGVWCDELDAYVGMASEADKKQAFTAAAFAIAYKALKVAFPGLRIWQPAPAVNQASTSPPAPSFVPRGATAFQPQDGELFEELGREALLDELQNAIQSACTVIQIHGVSGSGKSSLAQSGLAHRCEKLKFPCVRWEARPDNLDRVLSVVANSWEEIGLTAPADLAGIVNPRDRDQRRRVVILDQLEQLPPPKFRYFWDGLIRPAFQRGADKTTLVLVYRQGLHGAVELYRSQIKGADENLLKQLAVPEFDIDAAQRVLRRLAKASGLVLSEEAARSLLRESTIIGDTISPVTVGVLHQVLVNKHRHDLGRQTTLEEDDVKDLPGHLRDYVDATLRSIAPDQGERSAFLNVLLALRDENPDAEVDEVAVRDARGRTVAELAANAQQLAPERLGLLLKALAKPSVRILEYVEDSSGVPAAADMPAPEAREPRYRLVHERFIATIAELAGKSESPSYVAFQAFRRHYNAWKRVGMQRTHLLSGTPLKAALRFRKTWKLSGEQQSYLDRSLSKRRRRRAWYAIAFIGLVGFGSYLDHQDRSQATAKLIQEADILPGLLRGATARDRRSSFWINSESVREWIRAALTQEPPDVDGALQLTLALAQIEASDKAQAEIQTVSLARELAGSEQSRLQEYLQELVEETQNDVEDLTTEQREVRDARLISHLTCTACWLALLEGKNAEWDKISADAAVSRPEEVSATATARESKSNATNDVAMEDVWMTVQAAAHEYLEAFPEDRDIVAKLLDPVAPVIARDIQKPYGTAGLGLDNELVAAPMASMVVSRYLRNREQEVVQLLQELRLNSYDAAQAPDEFQFGALTGTGDVTLRYELIDELSRLLSSDELRELIKVAADKADERWNDDRADLLYALGVASGFWMLRNPVRDDGHNAEALKAELLAALDDSNSSHHALRFWIEHGIAAGNNYALHIYDFALQDKIAGGFQGVRENNKNLSLYDWFDKTKDAANDLRITRNETLSALPMLRDSALVRPAPEDAVRREDPRAWYHAWNGVTMVELPGGTAVRGNHRKISYVPENEEFTRVAVAPFDMAMMEVTAGQFMEFAKSVGDSEYNVKFEEQLRLYAMHIDGPCCNGVNLYSAAAFCNWMTQQENEKLAPQPALTPCYTIDIANKKIVIDLKATGYRLPHIDEWEYACRAGSAMRWTCGENRSLLGGYSWYYNNAREVLWPAGSRAPNAFGIFDMHGNVGEWTCDVITRSGNINANQAFEIPDERATTVDGNVDENNNPRSYVAICGGDVYKRSDLDRCARRESNVPKPNQQLYVGIRLARSRPPADNRENPTTPCPKYLQVAPRAMRPARVRRAAWTWFATRPWRPSNASWSRPSSSCWHGRVAVPCKPPASPMNGSAHSLRSAPNSMPDPARTFVESRRNEHRPGPGKRERSGQAPEGLLGPGSRVRRDRAMP